MLAVASASSHIDGTTAVDPIFSLSALVHDQRWMTFCSASYGSSPVSFCSSSAGLALQGRNLGVGRKRVDVKAKKASRLSPLFAGPPLAGGVGGVVVGFLFSPSSPRYNTAAFCVSEVRSVSSTAYFSSPSGS